MQTEYTREREARELDLDKRSELQRTESLLNIIDKYQGGIRDIRAKIEISRSEEARNQYKRIIKDYQRLERQLQEELGEIYARGLPQLKHAGED